MPSDAIPNVFENPAERICSLYKSSPNLNAPMPATPNGMGIQNTAAILLNGLNVGLKSYVNAADTFFTLARPPMLLKRDHSSSIHDDAYARPLLRAPIVL